MYLLDTNICIYLLNGNPRLRDKVKEIGVFSIGISNVTLAELFFGAYNSRNTDENLQKISKFRKNLNLYSDDVDSAELFGKLKAELKASGRIIDDFDILIASIAISNNCVLVTNNLRHFDRIESIQIENWL